MRMLVNKLLRCAVDFIVKESCDWPHLYIYIMQRLDALQNLNQF